MSTHVPAFPALLDDGPVRELTTGHHIPDRPLTQDEWATLGIDPEHGVTVPVKLDAIDAFGMMLITDTDSVGAAVLTAMSFTAENMPPGWTPAEIHVKPEDTTVSVNGNGVTVNPRTAQKWATVAKIAEYFAVNPGTTIKAAARELSISERHVYRVVTETLGLTR